MRAIKVNFALADLKRVRNDAEIVLLLGDHTEFKGVDLDTNLRDKGIINTPAVLR